MGGWAVGEGEGSSDRSGPHGAHGGFSAFTVRIPSAFGHQGGAVCLVYCCLGEGVLLGVGPTETDWIWGWF